MAKDLPINSKIVELLAKATVKNLIDGLVELITNSDDSYKRLEEKDSKINKKIIRIYVDRKKGGICEKLIVQDFAEGMTKEELEKAIEFAGETSGFTIGKSVRGFFGRGLKETIIALGEGEIKTVKDGKLCKTRVWFDRTKKRPQYDDELLNDIQSTSEPNGTEISINITNEKIKIPEFEKFKEHLSKHYALRDIMASSDKREILLTFEDKKRNLKIMDEPITFSYPNGKKIKEEVFTILGYGDKAKITIYESPTPLDSPRYNPYGLAGILIKTKGAILDNQLFKFENDHAALYFFGEVMCDGLEERLRKGETEIIDPNRAGLEWRHEYCQALATEIERILEPLIFEKKKLLEKKPKKEVKKSAVKMLRSLTSLLNEIANQELEEVPEVPIDELMPITSLEIKPTQANIPLDRPRIFTIYAPAKIVQEEGNEVHIKSDTADIQPLASIVKVEKHPKYPEILYRYFKVVGKRENAEGTLTVKLGSRIASSKVRVAPFKERRKSSKLIGRKGGFISGFDYDYSESPMQRTFYNRNTGIITIFMKSPSIAPIIKGGLDGIETPEGRILFAELVGEAFCRELARRKLDVNPPPPGSEIDAFNNEVNKIQRRVLHHIQKLIFTWKF